MAQSKEGCTTVIDTQPEVDSIVVVEAGSHIGERLRRSLEGVAVQSVRGLDEARAVLSDKVGLVLADLNGKPQVEFEALEDLKRRHASTLFMMASHSTDPADIVSALRRGIYDYFTHPLDFDALAGRIRAALQRRQAGEEAKHQLEHLSLVRDVTAKLTASLNARGILEGIATEVRKRIHFDAAIISIVKGDRFRPFAVINQNSVAPYRGARSLPLEGSAHQASLMNRRIVMVLDTEQCGFPDCAYLRQHGFRSFVVTPAMGTRDVLGAVTLCSLQPDGFNPEDCGMLAQVAAMVTTALSNTRLHSRSIKSAARLRRRMHEQTEKVADVRQHLSCLFQNAGDAIITTRQDGSITSCNPDAEDLLGQSQQKAMGKPVGEVLRLAGPESLETLVQRVAQSEQTIRDMRCRAETAPGKTRDLSVTISPIRTHAGKTVGISLVARDMTESTQLHREVVHAEKLATIGQIAAEVIHNVASPLQAISGRAVMVGKSPNLSEHEKTQLEKIVHNVNSVWETLQGVMGFSRKDASKRVPLDTEEVLRDAMEMLRFRSATKGVHVDLVAQQPLPKANGCRSQLMQVFMNALGNAIDAAPGGNVDIRVEKGMLPGKREAVRVTFTDDGEGMDEVTLSRVFESFFTTKAKNKGTGLGMPVSRRIIESHGGEITMESKPSQGAKCMILLPAAGTAEAQAEAALPGM